MANGFDPQKIRNVVVVGHKGSGKTALVEGMLYVGGAASSIGGVANKSSILDDEPEEINREATLQTSLANVVWKDTKINVIDTPGGGSFFGDTRMAFAAADAVVLTVSAKDGVQPMTERLNRWAVEMGLPRMLVITKCDLEHLQIQNVLEQAKRRLKIALAKIQVAVGEGPDMKGVVDVLSGHVYAGEPDGPKVKAGTDVPAEYKDTVDEARALLVEEVASKDDELLEKYLEEEALSEEEMEKGMKQGVNDGSLIPCLFTAADAPYGVAAMLDTIVDMFPAPTTRKEFVGKGGENRPATPDAPFAGFCFKATIDQHAGRTSFVRVLSGTIKSDSYVSVRGQKERVGGLFNVLGKPTGSSLSEVYAGDIIAITKLKSACTADTLSDDKNIWEFDAPLPPPALFARVVVLQDRGSGEKIAQGLFKLAEEDCSLKVYHDDQSHDLVCAGLSQLHLDVTLDRMKRRFGLDVTLGPPKIPYLETITRKAKAIEGKHKKQSGGHGQFGVCIIDMEPTKRGEGFVFDDAIVGGAIPRNFIPSVEKGIVKAAQRGFLAGFQVVDFKVRLYDGKYHPVDSSDGAFQMAGSKAFRAAMEKAGAIILEPVVRMEITVPTTALGDVMGDMNSRRGRILGTDSQDEYSIVNAQAPLVEVLEYEPKLRALTQGTGTFTMSMDGYEPVPSSLQGKVIKDSGFRASEDDE